MSVLADCVYHLIRACASIKSRKKTYVKITIYFNDVLVYIDDDCSTIGKWKMEKWPT